MHPTPLGRLLFARGVPSAAEAARRARLSRNTVACLVHGQVPVLPTERRRYSRSVPALAIVLGVPVDEVERAAFATRRGYLAAEAAEAARLELRRVNAAERAHQDRVGIVDE